MALWDGSPNQAFGILSAGLDYTHQVRACGTSWRHFEMFVKDDGLLDGQGGLGAQRTTESSRISELVFRVRLAFDLHAKRRFWLHVSQVFKPAGMRTEQGCASNEKVGDTEVSSVSSVDDGVGLSDFNGIVVDDKPEDGC